MQRRGGITASEGKTLTHWCVSRPAGVCRKGAGKNQTAASRPAKVKMSTSTLPPTSTGGLIQIESPQQGAAAAQRIEEQIRQRVAQERARLEREAGVVHRQKHHFHKPIERPFTKDQRSRTTLLFGGLTWKHEKLVHGALEGLGYKTEVVPTPDVKAFQLGKEYGNNGQCNPTYFTVGNLVQYLQHLESSGQKRE